MPLHPLTKPSIRDILFRCIIENRRFRRRGGERHFAPKGWDGGSLKPFEPVQTGSRWDEAPRTLFRLGENTSPLHLRKRRQTPKNRTAPLTGSVFYGKLCRCPLDPSHPIPTDLERIPTRICPRLWLGAAAQPGTCDSQTPCGRSRVGSRSVGGGLATLTDTFGGFCSQ